MLRFLALTLGIGALITAPAFAQDGNSQDKSFDVRSSVGDVHIGPDADAKKVGLPLYPGAHPKHEDDNNPLNFGILTDSFGMTLVVAKYESNDPPAKVLDFYREKMKKYGKVIECRGGNDNRDSEAEDHDGGSKPVKCEGDNTGPVRELKVGTEDNARVVAIENPDSSKGTIFALVYVHTRGKRGEI
jgi:hypothetical protein